MLEKTLGNLSDGLYASLAVSESGRPSVVWVRGDGFVRHARLKADGTWVFADVTKGKSPQWTALAVFGTPARAFVLGQEGADGSIYLATNYTGQWTVYSVVGAVSVGGGSDGGPIAASADAYCGLGMLTVSSSNVTLLGAWVDGPSFLPVAVEMTFSNAVDNDCDGL